MMLLRSYAAVGFALTAIVLDSVADTAMNLSHWMTDDRSADLPAKRLRNCQR